MKKAPANRTLIRVYRSVTELPSFKLAFDNIYDTFMKLPIEFRNVRYENRSFMAEITCSSMTTTTHQSKDGVTKSCKWTLTSEIIHLLGHYEKSIYDSEVKTFGIKDFNKYDLSFRGYLDTTFVEFKDQTYQVPYFYDRIQELITHFDSSIHKFFSELNKRDIMMKNMVKVFMDIEPDEDMIQKAFQEYQIVKVHSL